MIFRAGKPATGRDSQQCYLFRGTRGDHYGKGHDCVQYNNSVRNNTVSVVRQ